MRLSGAAAVALAALVAACGSATGGAAREPTVFAAASLTDVFPEIEPDARYSFAGSDELTTQIREGAPADVFASASPRYTDQLLAEGLIEQPRVFATNRLVLVVPSANPARIQGLDDLARPGVKLVVAAEGVPVGDYTRTALRALHATGVLASVVSEEQDVRGVLAKVALGEADAGFVYSTDAAVASDDVLALELPSGSQPPIAYTIAVARSAAQGEAAEAYVERVLSAEGQQALAAAGFGPP